MSVELIITFTQVSVELENVVYEGEGNTKKIAKLQAALKALEGLNDSGYILSMGSTDKLTWPFFIFFETTSYKCF